MDKSDITLERMRSFVRVAERGSLSAVARELGVGQSTITRHLRELEEAVGVPLLSRTTRRVTMTDEGRRYYANCVQILRLVEQARDEARGTRGQPAGTIRISCTAAIGVLHVSRLIFAFQDRYPDIAIDLSLTDERVDLVREGVDIALRLGPLTDSSMKLRPLGQSRRLLVAAPAYLAAQGYAVRAQGSRAARGHPDVEHRRQRHAGSGGAARRAPCGAVRRTASRRSRPCRARGNGRRSRHRARASMAGGRSLESRAADGDPAALFAVTRAAEHADRAGARGHRARQAPDRFSRQRDRLDPGH
ncbi:DNA-binding transcriptional LysR family regulator [Bradyrhizobium sp. USDA 10063]